ncbi:amidohydrolase family protein [Mycolicibacterium sp. CBMA 226]|uniref:amidohydrolase family protein n=1 Tax=Mycolicibacterium sp. CBMA 226 TaxID=2606611 RepID=UPI0012DDC27E|nr:amidohydrolase family protein [Mycolicibacterium sp. CBMA 226]MUL75437.1 amidohydrolase [Mycolicibacterium sp. CBMA 226]
MSRVASRVVALEEAFLHPRVWELFPAELQRRYAPVRTRLADVGPERIRLMDAAGIDVQVLSHVQPGIQVLADDRSDLAVEVCREVNDWLADVVRSHPARFAGFAMLPTQSPAASAAELERAVRELGLRGTLINGHTNGRYLDDPAYDVLLTAAAGLGVPIYLHPTDPPPAVADTYYAPFETTLVPTWGWPVETGTHLLRLITAGVFDRHPDLKVIVGHMGELLPFCVTRLNLGMTMADWLLPDGSRTGMRQTVGYYLRQNVYVTSSGVFDVPVFDCARAMLGLGNLMFSVDHPFQDSFAGTEFLARCGLSGDELEWFAHGAADTLLRLDAQTATSPIRTTDRWYRLRTRIQSKAGRALISALVS